MVPRSCQKQFDSRHKGSIILKNPNKIFDSLRCRYRLVPTHSDKPGSPLSGSLAVEPDMGHDGGDSSVVLQSEDESVLSPWGESNKKERYIS